MLSNMLRIVSNAYNSGTGDRFPVLHSMRTMAGLKTNDEHLNCIALGHELLNKTDVTIPELSRAGMSNRVLTGLILMKNDVTFEKTLDNISENYDASRVALVCLLDRGALLDNERLSQAEADERLRLQRGYMKIAAALNALDNGLWL
jgi:hypothetical protein